ncbi:MAG: phenylacetate-CoA oxygenase subunit PaaC [Granulosicoccus sp.]|nr:phenylacetate-CoA oxygenase subunit PaaC [Granulosicoccus sp.]
MSDHQAALFEALCRLGDNTLILGHRLSEWCGTAPALEEDIALANIALDLIGQTQMWLGLAADVENQGRSADDLAMRRDAWEFRNVLLTEQPNGDFGQTIMRQFLFDSWHQPMLEVLGNSSDKRVADIASKAIKEANYHLQRSSDLVIRLGDGSEESHQRMQSALTHLWPYVGELFSVDDLDQKMNDSGIAPNLNLLREQFDDHVNKTLSDAHLVLPESTFFHQGGKSGARHSEHLGHLLTQLQWLQRAYPNASW